MKKKVFVYCNCFKQMNHYVFEVEDDKVREDDFSGLPIVKGGVKDV